MNAQVETKIRVINTHQFGEIEVPPEFIYKFDNGLLGFDDLKEYVLISEESTEPLKWLISVTSPEIGFPVISPWNIDVNYETGEDIDCKTEIVMVIVTLSDEKGRLSANLKAPVIINAGNLTGKQIILRSDRYSPTHIISGS